MDPIKPQFSIQIGTGNNAPTGSATSSLWDIFSSLRAAVAARVAQAVQTCPPSHPLAHAGSLQSWFEHTKIAQTQAQMHNRMETATSYEEWSAAAGALDELQGRSSWKQTDESDLFDGALLRLRLNRFKHARLSGDLLQTVFLVRTSLSRGIAGVGNPALYAHTHAGTKTLIDDYISEVCTSIDMIVDSVDEGDPQREARVLLDQVAAAGQAFGRSALLLSGGGTHGMSHIGVVKALWKQKLLPRVVSGTSAGSIVAAVLCSKTDAEIPGAIAAFTVGELDVFVKEGSQDGTILSMCSRLLTRGVVFEVENLVRVMQGILGSLTFREAYNRTHRILNITVSSEGVYELPRLLNYVTAPDVLIWSAVAASCAVPFVFAAASLLAKDPRTGTISPWHPSEHRWIDGSVENDVPASRLAELFNVNHFIVSQVNPHVAPFIGSTRLPRLVHTLASGAINEASHQLHMLADIGLWPTGLTKARAILSQKYSGHITILPPVPLSSLPLVLQNPDPAFMVWATKAGETATWPVLDQIQNHCAIEIKLDEAVQRLTAQAAFTPSEVLTRADAVMPQRGFYRIRTATAAAVSASAPSSAALTGPGTGASTAFDMPGFSMVQVWSFWLQLRQDRPGTGAPARRHRPSPARPSSSPASPTSPSFSSSSPSSSSSASGRDGSPSCRHRQHRHRHPHRHSHSRGHRRSAPIPYSTTHLPQLKRSQPPPVRRALSAEFVDGSACDRPPPPGRPRSASASSASSTAHDAHRRGYDSADGYSVGDETDGDDDGLVLRVE